MKYLHYKDVVTVNYMDGLNYAIHHTARFFAVSKIISLRPRWVLLPLTPTVLIVNSTTGLIYEVRCN